MTALSADRVTPRRDGNQHRRDVAANAKIFVGGLVCLNAAGNALQGQTALNLTADGVAESFADNTGGADAAIQVDVRVGNFYFANSASGDAITKANVGQACYIVDDQTVALTNGSNTRSKAGTILSVSSTLGVLVAVGIPHN